MFRCLNLHFRNNFCIFIWIFSWHINNVYLRYLLCLGELPFCLDFLFQRCLSLGLFWTFIWISIKGGRPHWLPCVKYSFSFWPFFWTITRLEGNFFFLCEFFMLQLIPVDSFLLFLNQKLIFFLLPASFFNFFMRMLD